jgi:asparagine synthase (glutamine-hydrolysing)
MYVCAYRPIGEPLHPRGLFGPIAALRRGGEAEPTTLAAGPFLAVAAETRAPRPLLARWRDLIAVGDVRLDNRADVLRLARLPSTARVPDLEVVLRAFDAYGEQCLSSVLGDYAFTLFDARAHKLLAVRDAFGVKPLYYRAAGDTIFLASRMDLLATGEHYDAGHIADMLAGLAAPEDRTIWEGVRAIPAGGYMVQRGSVREGRRHWSPDHFEPAEYADERDAVHEFRSLFREAVRVRLGAPMSTWAQLSGGLDSSSVVAMAQDLYEGERLAGTVTLVDSLGGGDERPYSDAVVRRFGLRNDQLHDFWAWQDDGHAPPAVEGPRALFPFYARERRTADVIRAGGGRVLLSGFGSDHYLLGHLNYMADMAGRGRVGAAVREAARWSIETRQSFWSLLGGEVLRPLLPSRVRSRESGAFALPQWITPSFAGRTDMAALLPAARAAADRPGSLFAGRVARDIRSIATWVDRWPYGEDVEVRYPFLHRPLVEMGMRLPVNLRIRPETQKWVLREAMRGLLPDEVRTRVGKGTIDARILWSLERERHRIDALLRDPILGQMGCVDVVKLREAVDRARQGVVQNLVFLMTTLSLETWLSVRAGRWSSPAVTAATAA